MIKDFHSTNSIYTRYISKIYISDFVPKMYLEGYLFS